MNCQNCKREITTISQYGCTKCDDIDVDISNDNQ